MAYSAVYQTSDPKDQKSDYAVQANFGLNNNNNKETTTKYMETSAVQTELGSLSIGNARTYTKITGNAQLGVGIKAPQLDVATPLLFPPAIIVVLQVPAMYCDGGNISEMGLAIKDMFESHAKAVTGIDVQYSMDPVGQTPVGADSQQIVSPGKVTRGQVSPSFQFTEVSGNMYWNLIRKWMTDMNNPDTYAIGAGVSVQGGWTMSDYSVTFAAIQPDITHRPDRILDCAIFCNVFPTGTGELGMERNIGQIKHMDRNFTFQGIVQHNHYTKMIGRELMRQLNIHTLDFNWAPAKTGAVDSVLNGYGITKDAEHRRKVYGTDVPVGSNISTPDYVSFENTQTGGLIRK